MALVRLLADQYRDRFGGPNYPNFLPDTWEPPLPRGTFGQGPFGLMVNYVVFEEFGRPVAYWLETSRMGGTSLWAMRTDGVAECTDVVHEFHAIGDTPEQTDSNRARSNEANRAFWSRVDELGLGDTMSQPRSPET